MCDAEYHPNLLLELPLGSVGQRGAKARSLQFFWFEGKGNVQC
jgi:hypothetical protein